MTSRLWPLKLAISRCMRTSYTCLSRCEGMKKKEKKKEVRHATKWKCFRLLFFDFFVFPEFHSSNFQKENHPIALIQAVRHRSGGLGCALRQPLERTLQVWSLLAVSTQFPFAFHCVAMMVPLWPCRVDTLRPDLGHHSLTSPSLLPAAMTADSGKGWNALSLVPRSLCFGSLPHCWQIRLKRHTTSLPTPFMRTLGVCHKYSLALPLSASLCLSLPLSLSASPDTSNAL